jgi:hypothetical protein
MYHNFVNDLNDILFINGVVEVERMTSSNVEHERNVELALILSGQGINLSKP